MEEITGTVVMVHPQLTTDPIERQGQVGIIATADFKRDEFIVGFGSGPVGRYSSDALLVLKPHREINLAMADQMGKINTANFKVLMGITMIQENNLMGKLPAAMEMAASSEYVRGIAMMSLQEKLGIELGLGELRENVIRR